jgi:5-(carboxyamino)imidazole ribonucleotide synthase
MQAHIGILGGGQLAGMLAEAAAPLHLDIRVFERRTAPAVQSLQDRVTYGDWQTPEDVLAFADTVDVLTLENEFIPLPTLQVLEAAGHRVWPTAATMALIQDKYLQKQTLAEAGLPIPPCRAVDAPDDLQTAFTALGDALVLKQRFMSYDGKGNRFLHASDPHPDLTPATWYTEARCAFKREVATLVGRTANGDTCVYPVVETVQQHHICHEVLAPAPLSADAAHRVAALATAAVEAINGIGLFGVELFQMPDDSFLINELAPRVHNSGHYTIEACATSQFTQHLRIVTGQPLGSTALTCGGAAMINLLGDQDLPNIPPPDASHLPANVHLHWYGKTDSRPGRKMGHLTATADTVAEAQTAARAAADSIIAQPGRRTA